MTPDTYNARRLPLSTPGDMAPLITIATRIAQDALGLTQDGMLGPDTAGVLGRLAESPLAAAVLAELGNGEAEANNAGPDIARYFGDPYVQGRRYGEWCAALVSWCAIQAGIVGAGTLTRRERLGAKRCTTRLAELGSWAVSPSQAGPVRGSGRIELLAGDVICHTRGALDAWTGHVGIVLLHHRNDALTVADGNSQSYPSRVRLRYYAPKTWRTRLWAVARPQPSGVRSAFASAARAALSAS